jgi:hypothetical protein
VAYEALSAGVAQRKEVRASEASSRTSKSRKSTAGFYSRELVNGLLLNIPNSRSDALNQERVRNGYSKKLAYLTRFGGMAAATTFVSAILPEVGPTGVEGVVHFGSPFKEALSGVAIYAVWRSMKPKA